MLGDGHLHHCLSELLPQTLHLRNIPQVVSLGLRERFLHNKPSFFFIQKLRLQHKVIIRCRHHCHLLRLLLLFLGLGKCQSLSYCVRHLKLDILCDIVKSNLSCWFYRLARGYVCLLSDPVHKLLELPQQQTQLFDMGLLWSLRFGERVFQVHSQGLGFVPELGKFLIQLEVVFLQVLCFLFVENSLRFRYFKVVEPAFQVRFEFCVSRLQLFHLCRILDRCFFL